MTENRDYLPVNPVSQVCPKCGAKPGKACDMLTDRMALIHIERLKASIPAVSGGRPESNRRKF